MSNELDEFQRRALRTCSRLSLTAAALGLCGESGEFADHVKKHIAQGHALSPRQLALELGDVMWYVAIAATVLGYDLSEIAAMNEVKLAKRFADGHTVAEDVARKDVGDV